ncbi:MAG: hypothetical protein A2992_00100 [Elusimicrobia bacterium RIFCSPLOWO2_01_FULL_59_12]|nr:MAG: hypothetical protein A2992_00100 [Elusimicrobia bacterium RIFCSPLOWO2_01_FULL_59_12]
MLRKARILIIPFIAAALWAAETYVVDRSTPAAKPDFKRRRALPPQLQKLKAAGEKMLTPNPRFQGPKSRPMPPNAPMTPRLTPLPPPAEQNKTERFFGAVADLMTTAWNRNIFVWLPAFSTDPNTGPTYGLLPVLVLAEPEHGHIRHLFAPSYTNNSLFGQTLTGRYYFYPTDESQLFATGSYSQHTNREVKIRYEDAAFIGGRAFIRAEGYFDVDGSQRFFGIGPETREEDESGYTGRDKVVHLDMGVNFQKSWRLSGGLRYRRQVTDVNIIPNTPDLASRFPAQAADSGQTAIVQEAHLLWDTRDLPVTPSRGSSGEAFLEKTSRGWGSDADFIRHGVEGKRFLPWKNGRQITVLHALYDWSNGPNIPFFEMATLGGRDNLRGYGEGRFTDQGRIVFNAEHRVELASLALMGVTARFEAGPFIDVGTVFQRLGDMERRDFRPVFGGAFRAAVKPNVVGSVDVGVGKEGPGVYVGINYPF